MELSFSFLWGCLIGFIVGFSLGSLLFWIVAGDVRDRLRRGR